jgi:hypothetical protein
VSPPTRSAGRTAGSLQQFKPTVTNGIQSLVSAGVARLLSAQLFGR